MKAPGRFGRYFALLFVACLSLSTLRAQSATEEQITLWRALHAFGSESQLGPIFETFVNEKGQVSPESRAEAYEALRELGLHDFSRLIHRKVRAKEELRSSLVRNHGRRIREWQRESSGGRMPASLRRPDLSRLEQFMFSPSEMAALLMFYDSLTGNQLVLGRDQLTEFEDTELLRDINQLIRWPKIYVQQGANLMEYDDSLNEAGDRRLITNFDAWNNSLLSLPPSFRWMIFAVRLRNESGSRAPYFQVSRLREGMFKHIYLTAKENPKKAMREFRALALRKNAGTNSRSPLGRMLEQSPEWSDEQIQQFLIHMKDPTTGRDVAMKDNRIYEEYFKYVATNVAELDQTYQEWKDKRLKPEAGFATLYGVEKACKAFERKKTTRKTSKSKRRPRATRDHPDQLKLFDQPDI